MLPQAQPATDKIGNVQVSLYFGESKRDMFATADNFIRYFDNIAENNKWKDPALARHFVFALRGPALEWAKQLECFEEYVENYQWIKQQFLLNFGEFYDEQAHYYALKHLQFEKHSDPSIFGTKVMDTATKAMTKQQIVEHADYEELINNLAHIGNFSNAQKAEATKAILDAMQEEKERQRRSDKNFFAHLIFRGAVSDEYKDVLDREKPVTFLQAISLTKTEFLSRNKKKANTFPVVEAEENIDAVKQFKPQNFRGRGNFRPRSRGRGYNNNNHQNQNRQTKPARKCAHCGDSNHHADGCFKRMDERKPVIDPKTGKQYKPMKNFINEATEVAAAAVNATTQGFRE